jgi:hypothetical protein
MITSLIEAFGKTMGEHVLYLKGDGLAYLSLNYKCMICPEIEYDTLDDLYEKVSSICVSEGVDISHGTYEVNYMFCIDEEVDPYDDGLMIDTVCCYGFEIEDKLYELHDEVEMLKYNLDIHVISKKIL